MTNSKRIKNFRDESVLFILNKLAMIISKHKSKFNSLKMRSIYEKEYVGSLVEALEDIQAGIKKFRKLVWERRGW